VEFKHPQQPLTAPQTANMGQNLSLEEPFADTSKATLSAQDAAADIIVGIMWAGSFYAIGMIYCAVGLLRRWNGGDSDRDVNFFSILAAFMLSSGWPVVLLYFAMTSRG
jgi:hypothetical protein